VAPALARAGTALNNTTKPSAQRGVEPLRKHGNSQAVHAEYHIVSLKFFKS
jgi:hypothetical protein